MNLLVRLELREIRLDAGHKCLDVGRQHLGRETELPDRHTNDTGTLAVVVGAHRLTDGTGDVIGNCLHAAVGHETLGTEDATQGGLIERRLAVGVADEPVEDNVVVLDGLEDGLLARDDGAGLQCLLRDGASFGADYTDADVGFDGVRETDAILDDGAVSGRLEVDVDLVLDGLGRAADFECAEVAASMSVGGMNSLFSCRMYTHRMASQREN